MTPESKGNSSKHDERPGWTEASLNGSALVLSLVKEAATLAPFSELKQAASVALLILQTTEAIKDNREAYERLASDSVGFVAAIWRSYKKAIVPTEWLSAEMREILADLTHTFENIYSFFEDHMSRNKLIRVMFSRADSGKINEYRESLNCTMQKFKLQSYTNIQEVIMQLGRKIDQLSEQLLHWDEREDVKDTLETTARKLRDQAEMEKIDEKGLIQVEIDRRAKDDGLHSDQLKIEKETKDRLEDLQAALSLANHLKEAQEEEIAELRRKLAAKEDSRRTTTILASSEKKSFRRQDEIEEEEKWRGNVVVEVTSDEEKDVRWLPPPRKKARRSVVVEKLTSDEEEWRPPPRKKARRSVVVEKSTSDEEWRPPTRKKARGSVVQEKLTSDEEEDVQRPPVPRKSSKIKRKPQSSPGGPSRDVDDFLTQSKGFRQPELGFRAVSTAVQELVSHLKKAQEKEVAGFRRKIAAEEDRRQIAMIQAQSSEKKGSRWQADVKGAEKWGGNEKAISGEDVGRSGLVRRNSVLSESPNSRHVVLEDSSDDEDLRMPRRRLSSTSLHIIEAEDELIDEEGNHTPPLPRKSPKVRRNRPSSSFSPPGNMDDSMFQVPGFTPLRLASPHGYNLRMGSPMYFPNGSSFSPSMGPIYGYGVGGPRTVVHLGSRKYHQYIPLCNSLMNLGDHRVTGPLHRPKQAPALYSTFEAHMDYADANHGQVLERTLPIRSVHAPSPVPPNEKRDTGQPIGRAAFAFLPISLPNVSQLCTVALFGQRPVCVQ
ncbi:hypothetical protein BYT27DRAFT_7342475 [Phlegmacium glaucopus]|nr:hypothetical protein BYT27DRAFT_7342475 [Phlegmacium glaucopus]